MKPFGILLLLTLFIPTGLVSAQGAQLNILIDSSISLLISPDIPGPNQTVRARLESSSLDLDTSTIRWSLNGVASGSGLGQKTFSFTTGSVGSNIVITATIISPQGTFTKSINLEIGAVDILWQGNGYTHPFYRGKTLWGHQTGITFTAIPQTTLNTSSLIYRWSLDGRILGNSSGVGRNSLTIHGSILGLPRTVSVDVMRDQSTVISKESVSLSPIIPEILVYELHPLYGYLFNIEAGGQYRMRDEEITLSAFPMFFSAPREGSSINYEWRAGSARDTGSRVTYRTEEGEEVSTSVSVRASHAENFLQTVSRAFVLSFDPDNQ